MVPWRRHSFCQATEKRQDERIGYGGLFAALAFERWCPLLFLDHLTAAAALGTGWLWAVLWVVENNSHLRYSLLS